MSEHTSQDSQRPARQESLPTTIDTFEISTSDGIAQPVESLLAGYVSSTAGDVIVVESQDSEPILCHPVAFELEQMKPEPAVAPPLEPATQSVEAQSVEAQPVEAQPVEAQSVEAQPERAHATKSEPSAEDQSKAAPDRAAPDRAKPKQPSEICFSDLQLNSHVLKSVQNAGYEKPTEVQSEIIPQMLAGRDVLAQSQTGSGKTAAFALPILSRIDMERRDPQVLVLAPTRELAIQVAKSFSTYAGGLPGFSVAAIYGGQDYEPQLKQLRRGVHVVVGTPGRVIDHINRGTLDISSIDCLVLDEADEMLNMGFLEDVEFVLGRAPKDRQVALFSATLPGPIRSIAQQHLTDPAKITIKTKTVTAESIRQRALFVSPRDKIDVLTRFLEVEETDGVIVFTKTKDATVSVAQQLSREGFSAVALNGDMPQKVRERTIEQLKAGHLNILVATDVAARGLDVTRVSHVFNFDLPHDSEGYIHRVGRTGRAGRNGEAIIFLTNAQRGKLRLIERATKQPIEVVQPPTIDDINATRIKRFKQSIDKITADQDLTLFKDLIAGYAKESGKPIETIAAAIAQIGQQGRPFLKKNRPKRERTERRDGHRGGRGGYDGFDQDRSSQHARHDGRREGRRLSPPEQGMNRYRIEVGHRDGVGPGNIVGAVANEAGIDGQCIGPIQIHDSYSTIDLPEAMPSDIYHTLQSTRVAGKQLRLSQLNEGGSDFGHGNKGHRKEKSHGEKRHGGKSFSRGQPHGKAGGKPRSKSGSKTGHTGKPKKRKVKS